MSLLEHIAELRDRLVRCGVALAVATTVSFALLYEPLLHFLTKSYCDLPASYRSGTFGGSCRLAALGPLDPLAIRIRVALVAGLVLAMPYLAFQLWRFITPGLKLGEKRYAVPSGGSPWLGWPCRAGPAEGWWRPRRRGDDWLDLTT